MHIPRNEVYSHFTKTKLQTAKPAILISSRKKNTERERERKRKKERERERPLVLPHCCPFGITITFLHGEGLETNEYATKMKIDHVCAV